MMTDITKLIPTESLKLADNINTNFLIDFSGNPELKQIVINWEKLNSNLIDYKRGLHGFEGCFISLLDLESNLACIEFDFANSEKTPFILSTSFDSIKHVKGLTISERVTSLFGGHVPSVEERTVYFRGRTRLILQPKDSSQIIR